MNTFDSMRGVGSSVNTFFRISSPPILINILLAYRFYPLTIALIVPIAFYLILVSLLFLSVLVINSRISIAPQLMDMFCTPVSFWLAALRICKAKHRLELTLEKNTILSRAIWPSSLYRTSPLSRESSIYCSYSSRSILSTYSGPSPNCIYLNS